MSRPRLDEPLRKVTLDLFGSDVDELRRLYGPQALASTIRTLIRAHLRQLRKEPADE